jgi:5-methylcytosine-specific restriction endonuclease McrA
MGIRHKCKYCGKPGELSKTTPLGKKIYRKICSTCRAKVKRSGFNYEIYKKLQCECCGFKPVNLCQLDVDHIDGNKFNNKPENLQTLCANCHRLKTYLSGDISKQLKLDM